MTDETRHPELYGELFRERPSQSNWSSIGLLLTLGAMIPLAIFIIVAIVNIRDPIRLAITVGLAVAFGVLFLLFTFRSDQRGQVIILVLQTAIALFMTIVPGSGDGFIFVIFAILSAQIGLTLPPRIAAAWWLVLFAATIISTSAAAGLANGLLLGFGNATGHLFFVLMGGLMRQAQLAREHSESLAEELRAANAQLQAMSLQSQHLAVAEERNRMARELHDSLGHRLTVAVVQLEGAQRLIPNDPERAARMVGAMREQMKEGLNDLRRSVASLREPLDTDLPLGPALQRLAHSFQEGTGLVVHVDAPAQLPDLSAAHRLALFRAAQEALTNAQRHAQARQVWLALTADASAITLSADDDGVGLPADGAAAGFGLRGLQERAAQLGGQLHLGRSTHGGAQVTMTLPRDE
jgi:signal transduction histidine kinase